MMAPDKINILFLGSDSHWFQVLQKAMGSRVELYQDNIESHSSTIWGREYCLIVMDTLRIPKRKIFPTVTYLKSQQPGAKIVVVSASPTWTTVREALKAGATDYIAKSFDPIQVAKDLTPYLQP